MEQQIRDKYDIEYGWNKYITIFSPNQSHAIKLAKKLIKEDGEPYCPTGKICMLPVRIVGKKDWTQEQWRKEYNRMEEIRLKSIKLQNQKTQ